jgi:hypothetical protein
MTKNFTVLNRIIESFTPKIILSLFIPVVLISKGISQIDYQYESLSIKDGLSNNIIMDVCQDRCGFLWLATQDGWTKYDGYDIENFKSIPGDSTSLPDNYVTSIYEDRQGQFWVGTSSGLSKFDPDKRKFSNFPYELKDTTLSPGDTILMMSDGLPELFNHKKQMFGYDRVVDVFTENAQALVSDIIDSLKYAGTNCVNDQDPQDDVTFVVIKFK